MGRKKPKIYLKAEEYKRVLLYGKRDPAYYIDREVINWLQTPDVIRERKRRKELRKRRRKKEQSTFFKI